MESVSWETIGTLLLLFSTKVTKINMLILHLKEPIKVSISLITFGQLISLIMTEDRIKKPIELSFFSAKFGALKKIHFSKSIVTPNSHRTLFMDRWTYSTTSLCWTNHRSFVICFFQYLSFPPFRSYTVWPDSVKFRHFGNIL